MSRKAPREVELLIDCVEPDGFGTGLFGERKVRVKNGLAGETVTARILKRRGGVWYGENPQVPEAPSTARVTPGCEFFPRCGGCAMQHLNYAEQVAMKEQQLRDALVHEEVAPSEYRPAVLGPRFHYRTKARFGVRVVGGQVLIGFRESFSNRVGRMTSCETLVPRLAELIEPLRALIGDLSEPDRIPQVEVAAGDASRSVVLRHLAPLSEGDRMLVEGFSRRWRARCYLQSAGYDSIEQVLLTGASVPAAASSGFAELGYQLPEFGLWLQFRPWDFTQVNLRMNRRLVQAALLALDAPAGAHVLDLFCGIGNFSLALASRGYRVTGLEAAESSIERARQNARLNCLSSRSEFQVVDLYDPACELPEAAGYVLLDPPRSGAGPNLQRWIGAIRPSRVVYVSCNPVSFAADARVMTELGYHLHGAGIFDMFPHTAHVETLGVFSRH